MRHFLLVIVLITLTLSAAAQLRPTDPQGGIPVSSLEPGPLSVAYDVSIASDGSHYFAAWSGGWSNNADIIGTRVGSDGQVLDREGIPLAPTYEPDETPVVVWDGDNWLVFHSAGRLGGRVVKVSESGDVVTGKSTGKVRVTDAVHSGSRVHTVFLGFGMNWTPTVSWGVIGDDLTITEEISLDTNIDVGEPRIATDGTEDLVVWESFEEPDTVLHAALIDAAGAVVDRFEVARVAVQSPTGRWFPSLHPDVAWDGSAWIVVWSESGIRGVTITPQSAEPSSPFVLESDDGLARPRLAARGGEAIVTYTTPNPDEENSNDTVGVRLLGDVVTDRFTIASATGWSSSPVATNGSNFVVIAGGRARVIDTSGAPVIPTDPYPLTFGFRSENLPDVIGDETLLLTLQDPDRLRAWRFSRDGVRLDPPDRPIIIDGPISHVAAASEDAFLIAWAAEYGLFVGQRISRDGVVIDDEPFVIASIEEGEGPCSLSAAASDGDDFLVIFECREPGPDPRTPHLLRTAVVSSDGEAGPLSSAVVPHEFSQFDPEVTWTGVRYQLAWNQQLSPWPMFRSSPPAEFESWTMQLGRDGEPIGETLRVVGERRTEDALTDPAVASSDETVLVAGGTGGEILTPEGALIRTFAFDAAVPLPRAIWTGGDYLIWSPGGRRAVRVDPAEDGVEHTFEYFDPEGAPAIGGIGALSGGRQLLTYTIRWTPFPHAHEGFLDRAYYRISGGERRRGVRR